MEPKYLHMMIGLPASGKSTWVKNNVFGNTAILSTDQLIEDYASFKGKTYSGVFKEYIDTATDIFFNLIVQEVNDGRNILIDRTNLTVKSRKRIISLFPDDYLKVAIVVTCDNEEEFKNRLLTRQGKNIPWNVIEDMKKNYEEPSEKEGFCSITHVDNTKYKGRIE